MSQHSPYESKHTGMRTGCSYVPKHTGPNCMRLETCKKRPQHPAEQGLDNNKSRLKLQAALPKSASRAVFEPPRHVRSAASLDEVCMSQQPRSVSESSTSNACHVRCHIEAAGCRQSTPRGIERVLTRSELFRFSAVSWRAST